MTSLVFEPLVPLALWASLAAAGALVWVWYVVDSRRRLSARRWLAVVALMGLAVALPLVVLLNPTWQEEIPPPAGKPVLAVLVDSSASMAAADGPGGVSRFEQARRLVAALPERLGRRFEIEVRSFAGTTAPLAEGDRGRAPDGAVTDLAGAISEVLQAERPAGQAVLLLSDGIHNVGGEARVRQSVEMARSLPAPIYVKTLGGDVQVRDRSVAAVVPQEIAFAGQQVPLRAVVESKGVGGKAEVVLSSEKGEVAEQEVDVPPGGKVEVEFPLKHEKSGVFRYELNVSAATGEVTAANNSAVYVLRVVDEPIRVLLVEGKPYWDTKFLLRTLAQDPSIELTSVVRLAEGRFLERTLKRPDAKAESPARAEAWRVRADGKQLLASPDSLSRYQIVILGRDSEVYLTDDALVRLKRWLARDGGALVCFRGPPTAAVSQRLAPLLPVKWNPAREARFRMQLTETGRQLRWVPAPRDGAADPLALMPTLAAAAEPNQGPQAVVLATGQGVSGGSPAPVVTALNYGTGRVVVVEGSGMWRWAFLAPQFEAHEDVYATLWHSLTRWLASNTGLLPSQTRALRTDKIMYSTAESATASLLVRNAAENAPQVELRGSSLREPRSLAPLAVSEEPGAYRVAFGALPEGRYEASIAGSAADEPAARTVFDVRKSIDELLHLEANPGLMAKIAEQSGGAVLSTATPDELAMQLDKHLARSRPPRLQSTTAWDRPWVLAAILACWAASWGLRRRSGLV